MEFGGRAIIYKVLLKRLKILNAKLRERFRGI